ncbi:hypothetical protein CA51_25630 [Rosistilla oblonga]|nr:hypothetical protein CA51_25630 [Rosistilla oblonga]
MPTDVTNKSAPIVRLNCYRAGFLPVRFPKGRLGSPNLLMGGMIPPRWNLQSPRIPTSLKLRNRAASDRHAICSLARRAQRGNELT